MKNYFEKVNKTLGPWYDKNDPTEKDLIGITPAVARKMAEEMKREVAGDGVPDYSGFDHPTVIRNAVVNGTDEVDFHAEKDLEYLDIPAFLRRQAD